MPFELGKTSNLLGLHANCIVNKTRFLCRIGSVFRLFIDLFIFPLGYESQLSPKYETWALQTGLPCKILQNLGDFGLLTIRRLI